MKRWNIEKTNTKLVLYYKDLESAQKANPKAVRITECFDCSYLEYVNKIISSATHTFKNYRGKIVYKIPYNSAFVLVQLAYDIIDGSPFYYDSLLFQSHDDPWVLPVTWEMISPAEFYNRFLDKNHTDLPISAISIKELKALKVDKFWFKEQKAYYRDEDGYFYFVNKYDLPSKKSKEEFLKFAGNKEAVLARVNVAGVPKHTQWYSSMGEFLHSYKDLKSETSPALGSVSYTIKQRGYTKKHPEDREVVLRLPFFNLDKELEHETCTWRLAHRWCAMMEGLKQFGEPLKNVNWVEDLIKRWIFHNNSVAQMSK